MAANRPHTPGDHRKRITAIYWGSSGHRFKSCQPDRGKPRLTCGDVLAIESRNVEFGTILGPKVPGQQLASVRYGIAVRVQVALCRAQVSVAGDLSQGVQGHPGISHPGQASVAQAVGFRCS